MKIDRLLGIVMLLLQKDRVTAPYLAEKFEVSRRTINRDIENLCKAGIPIITVQGGKGGISIADGYRIDKSLLTYEEMQKIFTGWKAIDSIIINLSSHYGIGLTNKITLIKQAIHNNTRIAFHYFSGKGETLRVIEPYYLTFQWSSWYVFGYCCERKDFRLFKLNRLSELTDTLETFEPKEIPEERKDFEIYFKDNIQVTILFDESVKHRLIDDYGIGCYTVTEEGKLLFRMGFTNKDYLLTWILGFGDKAEVVYPKGLKKELKKIAENILKHYEQI